MIKLEFYHINKFVLSSLIFRSLERYFEKIKVALTEYLEVDRV